jgi:predicted RNA-binding protein YlxR (DUF448 family)
MTGSATRAGPRRRCVAGRGTFGKERLIRFVTAPDGTAVPDLEGTLPGRGLWVGAERALVERARRSGLLSRAGRVAPDIAERIEALLVRRCQDLLGLARRAGQLVAGFERVRAALAAGRAAVVVEAHDGAGHGRARVEALRAAVGPELPVVAVLDRAELGAALGRAEAVHLALAPGRLAERFAREATRLAGFRPEAKGDGGGGGR